VDFLKSVFGSISSRQEKSSPEREKNLGEIRPNRTEPRERECEL